MNEDQKSKDGVDGAKPDQKSQRRKIPGELPYTGSPGVLQKVLDRIQVSEKPSVFTYDFLGTVLGASGGAARPVIPILKATGILNAGAVPTDLYSSFQTDGGRAQAALAALRNGFSEIFKRNQYAHKADEKALTDTIIAITGLAKGDSIVRYILNTFKVFQNYAKDATDDAHKTSIPPSKSNDNDESSNEYDRKINIGTRSLGLVYNINVVLPETTNIEVYNAIFVSIRGNLLK